MRAGPAYALVFTSGVAALAWEALWQLRSSLAIGVSAMGAAITLATTMGGMTLGALVVGRALERASGRVKHPWKIYAAIELVIGISGALIFLPGFSLIERLDGELFLRAPAIVPFGQLVGIAFVIGLPAFAMGATVPVFGLVARGSRTNIAALYGINTAGAAMGVLLVTFGLVPRLGVELTAIVLAAINLVVALIAWFIRDEVATDPATDAPTEPRESGAALSLRAASGVTFVTGFAAFGLEVAWFRALRASFRSTTEAFAVMLVSVLVPLAFGARLGSWLRGRRIRMTIVLAAAGVATVLVTPVIERFDVLGSVRFTSVLSMCAAWLGGSLVVLGLPMVLLGTSLPWLLREQRSPSSWGRLYAVNAVGAVIGALVTAWVLLPALGFARSAWLIGAALVAASVVLDRGRAWQRVAAGGIAIVVAVVFESGAGRTRVIGNFTAPMRRIVAFHEGPDSTLAVADNAAGQRLLFIDGFVATQEGLAAHYMVWMGRLPMIVHPSPRRALVICFGTGQTANALRREGAESLDVVELNAGVLRVAPLFTQNEGVLDDPRVHPTVMDGRAWLRRTRQTYDVVTLEPMPPNFAGVNALYSREFYELVAARLDPGGVAAQWLPIHLLSVHDAVAIVATFHSVFPDSFIWLDPPTRTGIIVGRRAVAGSSDLASAWPGLARSSAGRDLDPALVRGSVALRPSDVAELARLGTIITDDNQLLAFGPDRTRTSFVDVDLLRFSNLEVFRRIREASGGGRGGVVPSPP